MIFLFLGGSLNNQECTPKSSLKDIPKPLGFSQNSLETMALASLYGGAKVALPSFGRSLLTK